MKLAMKFHELDIDDELLPGQGGADGTEERVLGSELVKGHFLLHVDDFVGVIPLPMRCEPFPSCPSPSDCPSSIPSHSCNFRSTLILMYRPYCCLFQLSRSPLDLSWGTDSDTTVANGRSNDFSTDTLRFVVSTQHARDMCPGNSDTLSLCFLFTP